MPGRKVGCREGGRDARCDWELEDDTVDDEDDADGEDDEKRSRKRVDWAKR